ncbi:helicase [Oryctes borbonicus]|uniref:Helicase n=1 Tax=Oryctes borbonicus TaxID=1629725 RepID=A0A0T6BB03_9SCAR|nr:helicase [Oryctes borbonicus]
MTEDVATPFANNNAEDADLSEESDSSSDKSDDNDSTTTEILINEKLSDEDEQEILNNISCSPSVFDSDSDSGHSLFSIATVVLPDNLSTNGNIENECNDIERESVEEDKAVKENEISDRNVARDDLQLKECHVLLADCVKQKSKKNVSESDQEKSIKTLINLENLNRKRKLDDENVTSKQKKIRSEDKSGNKDTIESDDDDTNCSDLDGNDIILNPLAEKLKSDDRNAMLPEGDKQSGVDILQMLLECIGNERDSLAATEIEDSSDSSTDVDKNQNKMRVADKKVSSKEQSENGKRKIETPDDVVESSSLDKEKQKRKQWRKSRLLREKLTDGSTDEEKEDNLEGKRRSRRKRKIRIKSKIDLRCYGISSSSDTTEAFQGSESSADSLSIVSLCFSSDSTSDNDIEFVEASSVECKEEEENNDDQSKTGRRNIRMVKSDALLTATTKKAQKEEEERRGRLQSQSQLLSEVETEELVLDINKETKEPLIAVDSNITQRLKAHQKEGVRFMWNNCYESVNAIKENKPGTGCILAHCMGLGKSLQVVALINTLFSHEITNTKHVIIICPLSTVLNWENEFKICDNIAANKKKVNRFLITDGKTKQERYRVIINWNKSKGVLILGYDSFHSLLKTSEGNKVDSVPKVIVQALLDPGPDLVICDEGHLIKNGTLNRTKTLAKIKTKRRIILTGTPMQNNLVEYFYMLDFVKPSLLGTKKEFCNRFINPIDNGRYDDSTEADIKLMRQRSHVLHDYLKDSIQRYEITELQQYLPGKLDYVLFIEPSPLQIELYETCLKEVQVNSLTKRLFGDYSKLRDIWTHPCILKIKEQNKAATQNKRKEVDTIAVEPEIAEDPGEWWHSKCPDDLLTNIEYGPKMKVMLDIIEHSVRLGDKLIIFGSQLSLLDAIEYFLQKNGWRKNESYLRMDGTVPPDMRVNYCNDFNKKNQNRYKLFLLTVQVGGLGLNLTAANRIILMDVNFNPAHDIQSIFRTYRFGQEKHCYVYRLVSIGTMEEVIYKRSVTKLAVSLRVVDEHQISRHYKFDDLQEMYRFTIYSDKERPMIKLPVDEVLASILEKCKQHIFKYHEHQHLLENRPEEQLNEDEQRLAWEEFRKEQEAADEQMATRLQNLLNSQNPPENVLR